MPMINYKVCRKCEKCVKSVKMTGDQIIVFRYCDVIYTPKDNGKYVYRYFSHGTVYPCVYPNVDLEVPKDCPYYIEMCMKEWNGGKHGGEHHTRKK